MRPNDQLYINSKKKKISKVDKKNEFDELYLWIYKRYNVYPLNIELNFMSDIKKRLDIVFEYFNETLLMYDDKRLNFNPVYQKEIIEFLNNNIINLNNDDSEFNENIFVSFRTFEQAAIEEANMKISIEELEALELKYHKFDVWKIYRIFDGVTIFYKSDKKLNENKLNGINKNIRDDYFKLIKKYDEFQYVDDSKFFIKFASKEDLDKNYDSNLYYFHK